jgi:hypothetical protein
LIALALTGIVVLGVGLATGARVEFYGYTLLTISGLALVVGSGLYVTNVLPRLAAARAAQAIKQRGQSDEEDERLRCNRFLLGLRIGAIIYAICVATVVSRTRLPPDGWVAIIMGCIACPAVIAALFTLILDLWDFFLHCLVSLWGDPLSSPKETLDLEDTSPDHRPPLSAPYAGTDIKQQDVLSPHGAPSTSVIHREDPSSG